PVGTRPQQRYPQDRRAAAQAATARDRDAGNRQDHAGARSRRRQSGDAGGITRTTGNRSTLYPAVGAGAESSYASTYPCAVGSISRTAEPSGRQSEHAG